MRLIARHGDREEPLTVERTPDGFLVRVGDAEYRVDAGTGDGAIDAAGRMSLRVDGAQYELDVHLEGDGRYRVSGRDGAVEVEVLDPLTHLAQEAHAAAAPQRSTVTAEMPGKVVAVLAAEGTEVRNGQGVVVVEAMKMENEIAAESDGVVKKLFVSPGEPVEAGEPLFEIG